MDTTLIEPGHRQSLHGLRWLILARLALITFGFAAAVFLSFEPTAATAASQHLTFVLFASWWGIGLLYRFLLPHFKRDPAGFVIVQFVIDMLFVTALAYLTGGVQSNFVNFYFVLIMTASLMVSQRTSGLFASLATVGLATIAALQLLGVGTVWLPYIAAYSDEAAVQKVLVSMLWTAVAFFSVAYLSGLLASRLDLLRSINEEILQNMAEGVGLFDTDGRLLFLNAEFETLFGHGRNLQLGDSAEAVFHLERDKPLRQLIRSRTTVRFEIPAYEASDHPRPPIEIRTSVLGTPDAPRGVVMLAIDGSLRVRAEIAERRAARFSAMSEMAAGLAHEIRNPLASVRGSIQEISRDFTPESANGRLAAIVLKESDRLDRIITHFLQYARQRPLHTAPCNLVELLREVQTLLQNRSDIGSIKIVLETEACPLVHADADQLREVFTNFGVNAISAMNGEGTLTIRCPDPGCRPPGSVILRRGEPEGVTISILDTGPGLSPEQEEKVFEPFFTTKAKGTGLGLAIARRVIEAHDGMIWAQNRKQGGALFCCWLPTATREETQSS